MALMATVPGVTESAAASEQPLVLFAPETVGLTSIML